MHRNRQAQLDHNLKIMPVKELTQSSKEWTIKVKIQKKSAILKWRTAAAAGEMFTVDLIDVEGTQILGSFLCDQVPQFYPVIHESREYIVTGG